MATALHLAVQYASALEAPSRSRIRRLVVATLRTRADEGYPVESLALVVRFVERDEGLALNRSFRGKAYATNVLTFPYPASQGAVEADVVICLPVVSDEARAQKKSTAEHCAHLIVHGALHACGHDHEVEADAEAMEAVERRVLAGFGIADPYRTAR